MRVNVQGHGVLNFPDTMDDAEVKAVLDQLKPEKDDTVPNLCKSIESMLGKQKPQVIEVPKIVEIEKQVVVVESKVVEIKTKEKADKTSWHFEINREDDEIVEIIASPIDE